MAQAEAMSGSGGSGLLLIGLTGGIGSGKSTAAGLLERYFLLEAADADALSRELTAAGGAAIAAIAAHFGSDYIDAQGAMDRARMRALVFADPQARQALQAITHPLIMQAIDQRIARARESGAGAMLLEIPLLVEALHWRRRLHKVVVVDCPQELQVQRVMQRSGLAGEEVRSIIAAQASRARRLAAADAVLFNGQETVAQLQQQVLRLGDLLGLSRRI